MKRSRFKKLIPHFVHFWFIFISKNMKKTLWKFYIISNCCYLFNSSLPIYFINRYYVSQSKSITTCNTDREISRHPFPRLKTRYETLIKYFLAIIPQSYFPVSCDRFLRVLLFPSVTIFPRETRFSRRHIGTVFTRSCLITTSLSNVWMLGEL